MPLNYTQTESDISVHYKYIYYWALYHFLQYLLESAPPAIDFTASVPLTLLVVGVNKSITTITMIYDRTY